MANTKEQWAAKFEAWDKVFQAKKWTIFGVLLIAVVVLGSVSYLFQGTDSDPKVRVQEAPTPENETRLMSGDARQADPPLHLEEKVEGLTPELKARIHSMYVAQNYRIQEIARTLGLDQSLVQTYLTEQGLLKEDVGLERQAQKQRDQALKDAKSLYDWQPGRELIVTPHDPKELDGISPERQRMASTLRNKKYGPPEESTYEPERLIEPLTGGSFVAHIEPSASLNQGVIVPGTFFEARLEGRVIASFFSPIVFARVFDQDGQYIGRAIGKAQLKRHLKHRAFMTFSEIYRPDGEVLQGAMIGMDRDLAEGIYGKADRKTVGTLALVAVEAMLAAFAIDSGGDGGIWDVFRVNLGQNLIQDARQRLGDVDLSRTVELERDQSFIIAVTSVGRTKTHEAHPLSSAQALREAREVALKTIPKGQGEMTANMQYALSELEKAMAK